MEIGDYLSVQWCVKLTLVKVSKSTPYSSFLMSTYAAFSFRLGQIHNKIQFFAMYHMIPNRSTSHLVACLVFFNTPKLIFCRLKCSYLCINSALVTCHVCDTLYPMI